VPSHDLDVLSLMAGVGFVGFAVAVLVGDSAGVAGRWTWPVLLIIVGIVGLIASRRGTKE
jgi:hypothetical protein